MSTPDIAAPTTTAGAAAAKETLEDYTLRFAPRNYRRWGTGTVAISALGGIAYLADSPSAPTSASPTAPSTRCGASACSRWSSSPPAYSLCLSQDKTGEHVLPAQV
jgi:hypothetical protein